MKLMRFSLFYRIMLWFFLNLLLLGAILFLIFNLNFRFESNSPFFGGATNRIESLARLTEEETNEKSREERDAILKNYSDTYKVEFFLFDNQGKQLGGREIALPAEVYEDITRPEPPMNRGNAPRPGFGARPPGPPPSVYVKTDNPKLYWFGVRTLTFDKNGNEPKRTRVLAASDSFYGNGLFFDPTPWIVISLVVIAVSMLFWFPFARGITKTISQMTNAAERIADEDFDVRVGERRSDELGRLGKSINHLATRLSGFVGGQKRFLGDVSHELNSPLARMQFALSILEDRVDKKNLQYVEDVKEEVELMSRLVGELLTYSKAGIKAPNIELEKVRLRPLVEMVVEREKTQQDTEIEIAVDENLEVSAQPELLIRAVGNVVRNAVRYAGNAGKITVAAENGSNQVKLSVSDSGAGFRTGFERLAVHTSRRCLGVFPDFLAEQAAPTLVPPSPPSTPRATPEKTAKHFSNLDSHLANTATHNPNATSRKWRSKSPAVHIFAVCPSKNDVAENEFTRGVRF